MIFLSMPTSVKQLYPSVFLTKFFYEFLVALVRAASPVGVSFLDLIMLAIFSEQYKLRSTSPNPCFFLCLIPAISVANLGPEVRSCGNATLLNPTPQKQRNSAKVVVVVPLLCYIIEHFFHTPPVSVVWRCPASQTEAQQLNHALFCRVIVKLCAFTSKNHKSKPHATAVAFP